VPEDAYLDGGYGERLEIACEFIEACVDPKLLPKK